MPSTLGPCSSLDHGAAVQSRHRAAELLLYSQLKNRPACLRSEQFSSSETRLLFTQPAVPKLLVSVSKRSCLRPPSPAPPKTLGASQSLPRLCCLKDPSGRVCRSTTCTRQLCILLRRLNSSTPSPVSHEKHDAVCLVDRYGRCTRRVPSSGESGCSSVVRGRTSATRSATCRLETQGALVRDQRQRPCWSDLRLCHRRVRSSVSPRSAGVSRGPSCTRLHLAKTHRRTVADSLYS